MVFMYVWVFFEDFMTNEYKMGCIGRGWEEEGFYS